MAVHLLDECTYGNGVLRQKVMTQTGDFLGGSPQRGGRVRNSFLVGRVSEWLWP